MAPFFADQREVRLCADATAITVERPSGFRVGILAVHDRFPEHFLV